MDLPWWMWAIGGVVGTVGGTVGVGISIAKAQMGHDAQTCDCFDCRKKRYAALKRQGYNVVGTRQDGTLMWAKQGPARSNPRWMSTTELEPRMIVRMRDQTYRITEINIDTKGYLIGMQPMGGRERRMPVVAVVPFKNADIKQWEPR